MLSQEAVFRDRITGSTVSIGPSMQNGISFRFNGKPAVVVHSLSYRSPKLGSGRDFAHTGHLITSPQLSYTVALPFDEAASILDTLYRTSEMMHITHDLPPPAALAKPAKSLTGFRPRPPSAPTGGSRSHQKGTARPLGLGATLPPHGTSPGSGPSPHPPPAEFVVHNWDATAEASVSVALPLEGTLGGTTASSEDVSPPEAAVLPPRLRMRGRVILRGGDGTSTELPQQSQDMVSPTESLGGTVQRARATRPLTALRVTEICPDTLPQDAERGGAATGQSPLDVSPPRGGGGATRESSWMWEQLRMRESANQVLQVEAKDGMARFVAMEKQAQIAQEKYIEQTAMVERLRLGMGGTAPAEESNAKKKVQSRVDTGQPVVGSTKKMRELRKWMSAQQEPNTPRTGELQNPKREFASDPPVGNAEDALSRVFRKIQQEDGDSTAVLVGLDTIKRTVGLTVLNRELKKWATSHKADKGIGGSASAKYGDGVAEARAPDQTEKLEFYPEEYNPERGVRQTVEDISSWRGPTGCFWPQETFVDVMGSLTLIEQFHSAKQPPTLVLPFYTYSLSLFKRIVWACWCSVKGGKSGWEVLMGQAEYLERQYYGMAGDSLELDPQLFKSVRGLSQFTDTSLRLLPRQSQSFTIDVFRSDRFVFVRYENTSRGDGEVAPLHETVLWLPPLKLTVNTLFQKPLDQLPPPGLIEYLFSRLSGEKLTWAQTWSCKRAVGPDAVTLIRKCLNVVDQQKIDFTLTQSLKTMIQEEVPLMGPSKKKDQQLLDTLKLVILTKLTACDETKGGGYTPQGIAHALDIQKLVYNNKTFCLSLAGSPCLIAEVRGKPDCIELSRLKHAFDDQIYWHINAAMRNLQFQNVHPTIQIQESRLSSQDMSGLYVLKDTPPTADESLRYLDEGGMKKHAFVRETSPFRKATWNTKRAYWEVSTTSGLAGCVKPTDVSSMNLGTWMLLQVQPFVWYLDRALEHLRIVDQTTLPHEVVPPKSGVKNYRGLAGVSLDRRVYDLNKIVLWGQFSSSSIDRGVASAFAKAAETAAVFTLLGKNCVCIAQWSRFAREHEWLYPPNSIFKVTNCLAEEHQMILDKANLQLFSMEEVDEFDAIETYLRGLVPCITGDDAPTHVMQLFNIIHQLTVRCPEEAIMCLLNPVDKAMYTAEGMRVAHRLILLNKKQLNASREPSVKTPMTPPMEGGAPWEVAERPPVREPQPKSEKERRQHLYAVDLNLLKAADIGSEEALEILIGLGANIETMGGGHMTPLQLAAVGGHFSAVKKLIKIGANMEAAGGGFTAVELAALRRDHVLTELLREACPSLAGLVPQRLEEYQPHVKLPPMGQLRKALEAAGLKWDRTRAKHSEQAAIVVLFDRERNLFWLRFNDDSTDLYPSAVLTKPTEAVVQISTAEGFARRRSVNPEEDSPLVRRRSSTSRRHSSQSGFALRVVRKQRSPSAVHGHGHGHGKKKNRAAR